MKLQNPFSEATRNLWIDHWQCLDCGCNGQGVGGLELHHITGRDSNAPVNGAVVCKECHSHYGHSKKEEKRLFGKNLAVLLHKKYDLTNKDIQFMEDHPYLLTGNKDLDNMLL